MRVIDGNRERLCHPGPRRLSLSLGLIHAADRPLPSLTHISRDWTHCVAAYGPSPRFPLAESVQGGKAEAWRRWCVNPVPRSRRAPPTFRASSFDQATPAERRPAMQQENQQRRVVGSHCGSEMPRMVAAQGRAQAGSRVRAVDGLGPPPRRTPFHARSRGQPCTGPSSSGFRGGNLSIAPVSVAFGALETAASALGRHDDHGGRSCGAALRGGRREAHQRHLERAPSFARHFTEWIQPGRV